jgi:hypothetical protein
MATQGAPVATQSAAIWEDFIDIFYAPSAVFRRRENGNVFIPLAVITILCGVIFYLNSGALQPMFDAEFDRQMRRRCANNIPRGGGAHAGFAMRMAGGDVHLHPDRHLGVGVTTWLRQVVDAKQTWAALVGRLRTRPRHRQHSARVRGVRSRS